jgi:hypothetical protein
MEAREGGDGFDAIRVSAEYLKSLARVELLILDDWGLAPLTSQQGRDLREIVDDRHGRGSTAAGLWKRPRVRAYPKPGSSIRCHTATGKQRLSYAGCAMMASWRSILHIRPNAADPVHDRVVFKTGTARLLPGRAKQGRGRPQAGPGGVLPRARRNPRRGRGPRLCRESPLAAPSTVLSSQRRDLVGGRRTTPSVTAELPKEMQFAILSALDHGQGS